MERDGELDLSGLLRGFDYEPGRLVARIVRAADGRELLQVRIELGVLQMECDGRPDGRESVLPAAQEASDASGAPQTMLAAALRLELVQYQQRAVALLAMGDARRALRDAEWVLRCAGLVGRLGGPLEAEWADGARFSAVVLRTRAAAATLATAGRAREAGSVIDAGLALLRDAAERVGIDEHFETLADVRALRALRDALVPQLPPAQRSELEERLRAAVRSENYELAAILRDELRLL